MPVKRKMISVSMLLTRERILLVNPSLERPEAKKRREEILDLHIMDKKQELKILDKKIMLPIPP